MNNKPTLIVTLALCAMVCACSPDAQQASSLRWYNNTAASLPDLPDTIGYGGPFTGTHNNVLMVAGGANFPDGPPWQRSVDGKILPAGTKKWHDNIYLYKKGELQWNTRFKLPRPLAYGASITTADGLVIAGGSTDGNLDVADVYRLRWDVQTQSLHIDTLPSLPLAVSKINGARIEQTIYVTASLETNGVGTMDTRYFWSLDLSKLDQGATWKSLPVWPGKPRRMMGVAVQTDAAQQEHLYLFSGMSPYLDENGKADLSRFELYTDGYRYDPRQNSWTRIADLPVVPDKRDVTGEYNQSPRPVSASAAIASGRSKILLFSGATGRYILRPLPERPTFPTDVLAYDTITDSWSKISDMPIGTVTTKAAWWEGRIVIPSGEIQPGVRTPKVQSVAAPVPTSIKPKTNRPNIVVIMVDDMGYSDIGCYGGEVQTPNIDRLATNGLKFSQFYNAARCCPTRAALLTGLYPHKTGIGFMTAMDLNKPGYRGTLNDQCVTIAESLKAGGYNTYMTGKWHACRNFDPTGPKHAWPLQRGFDKFYGTLIAAGSYWNPITLMDGNTPIKPTGDFYYTDAMTDKAIEYIDQNGDGNPFFLYMAYTAPHWPLHARKEVIDKYRGRFSEGWDVLRQKRYQRMIELGLVDPRWKLPPRDQNVSPWSQVDNQSWQQTRMEAYAAAVDHVDQAVGRLVRELKQRGQLENTVILFLSDNGGDDLEHPDGLIGSTGRPWAVMRYVPLYTKDARPVVAGDIPGLKLGPDTTYGGYGKPWAHLSNTPFKRFKKYTHEGGISTPLIVHWPAGIKAQGEIRQQVGHVIDLMPTCLELAGVNYPVTRNNKLAKPLDGVSLVPVFSNQSLPPRALAWEHRGNKAIREGRWKLVAAEKDQWELYDLKTDRTETINLADKYPAIVRHLKNRYHHWAKRVDVLPWESLHIPFIPPSDNPLTRTEQEMNQYYDTLKKHGINPPFLKNN